MQKLGTSGSSSTTTTTTKTTKIISGSDVATVPGSPVSSIKPIANSRSVVIARSTPGTNTGIGTIREVEMRRSYGHSTASAAPGAHTNVMHSGVNNIVQGREREKRDMQELNERFANYIEKVRFLEAQNKKLANELGVLKDRWGKETEKIKAMYDTEMAQLRKLLAEAERGKSELDMRMRTLEDQVAEQSHDLDAANKQNAQARDTINRLNQQLADCEREIGLLRRQVASHNEERARDRQEIERLRNEVKRLRADLDQETLSHINAENEAQSLRDELEFLKQVHDSELKDLAALAYRDTTQENREFWRTEMSQALRDIQTEYDQKMDAIRGELETYYNVKVQEFRTSNTRGSMELGHLKEENSRVKTQMQELRDKIPELEARNAQMERLLEELRREMEERSRDYELEKNGLRKELSNNHQELESVLQELQSLLDAKLSLELEIVAYRKLLEGEESRVGMRNLIEESTRRMTEMEATRSQTSSIVKGEMSAKTTYQRNTKGNISIQECSPDGKFVTLENTGTKREDISGMKLTRNTDNGRLVVQYTIPPQTFLEAEGRNKMLKIWARGQRPAGSTELECSDQTWGVGSNIQTVLSNAEGEERATHAQRTVYNT